MRIVLTGGGSGGHITPILATAHELKKQVPDCEIIYIGQRGDDLLDVVESHGAIDHVETVSAGKLRRYANEGWRQLLDVRSQALNIRDMFRTVAGIGQSVLLLGRLRPDVVFTRGGYVSVPVAFGAKINRIPYITHDSDSTPSLANRLIAPWAVLHAVALPADLYPYEATKTQVVGIPVSHEFQRVSHADKLAFRQQLDLAEYKHVLLITGGGNGARKLNIAVAENARYLLGAFPDLAIVHVAGRNLVEETAQLYDELQLGNARQRVFVHGFLTNLHAYSGAADIIVARGGATNLAEFALQEKAVVLVPSAQLIWNVRNSKALAERGAVLELDENQAEQPERLGRLLGDVLGNAAQQKQLGESLATIAKPNAARELAKSIINVANEKD